jgi:hypothetical protein
MRDASPTPAQPPTRHGFVCACCGHFTVTAISGLFANPRTGSPHRFCSPACRTAAWRRRRAGASEDTPRQHHGGRGRHLADNPTPDPGPTRPEAPTT